MIDQHTSASGDGGRESSGSSRDLQCELDEAGSQLRNVRTYGKRASHGGLIARANSREGISARKYNFSRERT
eukprot:927707-Pleurochrysis_carterae.AAC.4